MLEVPRRTAPRAYPQHPQCLRVRRAGEMKPKFNEFGAGAATAPAGVRAVRAQRGYAIKSPCNMRSCITLSHHGIEEGSERFDT
jgi:hypothetical protein